MESRSDTNGLAKQSLTDLENEFLVVGVVGGGERKRIIREFGMDMCTVLYLKWITN